MFSVSTNRTLIYLAGFFLAAASALPAYISSSFLSTVIDESKVGLVYTAASLLAIILLSVLPRLIAQNGRAVIGISLFLAVLSGLILATAQSATLIVAAFIIYHLIGYALRFIADLKLEEASQDGETGTIRGLYLTMINLAWLVAPFIAANLVINETYGRIYLLAAVINLPIALLLARPVKTFSLEHSSPLAAAKLLLTRREKSDLRWIITIDFLLNFFYAIMVIYTPVYLHQHIGLSWGEIGIIFTWMLLPFVLLDYPLGRLADKYWGEKEILIAGLIIAGAATISLAFVSTTAIVAWAAILFLTRVGAASIEAMKEIYLFKKISATDTDILSLSRNMVPLSYVIAPLLASVFLLAFPLKFIFLALGLIMFLGLLPALKLLDTK